MSTTKLALPSLELLHEHMKRTADEQNNQVSTLDTKAGLVLGSASFLTAGVSGFQGGFTALPKLISSGAAAPRTLYGLSGLALLAVGLYLALVWSAVQAYRLRGFTTITQVQALRDRYLDHEVDDTRLVLLDAQIEAIKDNGAVIDAKANWTKRAIWLLLGEAVLTIILIGAQLVIQMAQ